MDTVNVLNSGNTSNKNNKNETPTRSFIEMLKLGIVLCLYAVFACTILAIVNYFTLPIITNNKLMTAQRAMKNVFGEADNFEKVETFDAAVATSLGVTISDLYKAKNGDAVIGAVCQASGTTYDKAKIMVGLDTRGIVTKIEFLELTDSPGFGQKAKDPSYHVASGKTFYDQFSGLSSSNGFSHGAGGTIDAISGATITTVGVEKIITAACSTMASVLGIASSNNSVNIDATAAATSANSQSSDEAESKEDNNNSSDANSVEVAPTNSTNSPDNTDDYDDKSANGDVTEYIESTGV